MAAELTPGEGAPHAETKDRTAVSVSPRTTIGDSKPRGEVHPTPNGVHIARFGSGPRVFVGFHGWGSTHLGSFSELLRFLPDDATFYGVDLPGCGESAPPRGWSWDIVCEEIARAIDTIAPGQKLSLVGSCSGSYHVLATALRRPERVEQLVMMEPFAFMPWFFGVFTAPITGRLLYRGVFDNPIGRLATELSLRKQGVSNDYDMVNAFGRHNLDIYYRYLMFYDAITHHSVFASIDAPVRVVTGQNSWQAIHDSVPLWRENWPELEAISVEGVGHMLTQEAPLRVAAALFRPPAASPGRAVR